MVNQGRPPKFSPESLTEVNPKIFSGILSGLLYLNPTLARPPVGFGICPGSIRLVPVRGRGLVNTRLALANKGRTVGLERLVCLVSVN